MVARPAPASRTIPVLMAVIWFILVVVGGLPASAQAKLVGQIDSDVLGMPSGPWPFVRMGPDGPETYLIPTQLDAISRLPEPERSSILRFVEEHDASLSSLRETSRRLVAELNPDRVRASPEYTMDLGEVMMGVDFHRDRTDNPLHAHEPVFKALPSYTKVVLVAPTAILPKVRARLAALGLSKRVRLLVSQDQSGKSPGEGVTRWVRDVAFVAKDGERSVLLVSLAHKYFLDVALNDLAYLGRLSDRTHQVVRMPIFFRGGNLAIASAGRTVLLVGSDEVKMNQKWFAEGFGFTPLPNALPEILRFATGAKEVVILPNSRNLYHVDLFITPLGEGTIGLLAPDDPERMDHDDRAVLLRTRETLQDRGFRVVPIPTTVARMRHFQSSTNIVNFTERGTGRRRALVPMFPEPADVPAALSVNVRVLAAYRGAGIDPIAVEDRFHPHWGNTHCVVLPLR